MVPAREAIITSISTAGLQYRFSPAKDALAASLPQFSRHTRIREGGEEREAEMEKTNAMSRRRESGPDISDRDDDTADDFFSLLFP